jgi:hypothetical protein
MSFDPMAAVVDWLDAYRSSDLETTLGLYADNAIIECSCNGMTSVTGRHSLRAYLKQRFEDYPASELDDLHPACEGVAIIYLCNGRPIRSDFEFNTDGQITFQRCSPQTRPLVISI